MIIKCTMLPARQFHFSKFLSIIDTYPEGGKGLNEKIRLVLSVVNSSERQSSESIKWGLLKYRYFPTGAIIKNIKPESYAYSVEGETFDEIRVGVLVEAIKRALKKPITGNKLTLPLKAIFCKSDNHLEVKTEYGIFCEQEEVYRKQRLKEWLSSIKSEDRIMGWIAAQRAVLNCVYGGPE